jgi:hypothetical protein
MNWFEKFGLRYAAKRYAKRLPAELFKGWGGADFYTFGQVRAALRSLGLGGMYDAIAYAGFVTEEDYRANAQALPRIFPYDQARALLSRYLVKPDSATYAYDPITNEQAVNRYL